MLPGMVGFGFMIVWVAHWLAMATPPAADFPADAYGPSLRTSQQPLVAIAEVVADAAIDEPYPVRVRGVVTWRRNRGIIIQEGDAGIWIDAQSTSQSGAWRGDEAVLQSIRPGMKIEVEGLASRGGYMPIILAATLSVVGEGPEPKPLPLDPNRFFTGQHCCLRVTTRGTIQGYRDDGAQWVLLVADGPQRFTALVSKHLLDGPPDQLVDAQVSLVGVAVTHFNTRGEFLAPRLLIVHRDDIAIEKQARGSAFDAPLVPLAAIGHYRPLTGMGGRIRTQGTVTFSDPGQFLYLQEGPTGVRVQTESPERFAAGDKVEVSGFVETRGRVVGIVEATIRRTATGPSPVPLAVDPTAILRINADASRTGQMAEPGDYQGCLVTFPAEVVDLQRSGMGGVVLLAAGETSLTAVAKPDVFEQLRSIEPGSSVQVTGIIQFAASEDDDRLQMARPFVVGRLELLVRSANDFVVTRAPSWWKPHRLAAMLAAVAAVAAVAMGWVVLLRRKVAHQLALIESKLQAEAATEERQRIAREFHDTLEQGLAAVSLRLDVAAYTAADERSRHVLQQQRQLLSGLQTETRDFLWDLRDPVHVEGTLEESLALQLRNLEELSATPLHLEMNGRPATPPRVTHYHLLRIVREAVNNAIKHSQANCITVQVDARAESLEITVRDDGTGFDVAGRSHAEGHFGLRGMQERARQIGATCVIESDPKAGTCVRLFLPAAHAGLGNGCRPAHAS